LFLLVVGIASLYLESAIPTTKVFWVVVPMPTTMVVGIAFTNRKGYSHYQGFFLVVVGVATFFLKRLYPLPKFFRVVVGIATSFKKGFH